jgi:hypothetical protein
MKRSPSRAIYHCIRTSVLVASLAFSAPALAVPYAALFDGPAGGDGQNFGLSASSAAAAQAAGVPVVVTPIFTTVGVLEVVNQDLASITVDSDDLDIPFEIDSTWTVESVFSTPLIGNAYLVFPTTDPRTIDLGSGPQTIEYEDSLVGLVLDGAQGWALIQVSDPQLGTLFYPAISLGSLDPGQQKDVELRYHLEQLFNFPVGGGQELVPLPTLRIRFAFVPIPEPTTGLLVATGLLGLAARTRSRS